MALERRERNRRYEVFLVSTVVVLFLALPFGSSGSSRSVQSPGATEYQVRNYVNALEIESQKMVGEDLVVRLRNVSGKDITAWAYSTGFIAHPGGRVQIGCATGAVSIAAGEVEKLEFSKLSLYHISLQTEKNIALINITAVVFDDLTSEGDSKVTSELIERGKGSLAQLKRIGPLLKTTLKASDGDLDSRVRELEAQIAALPDSGSRDESPAFRSGLVEGKQYVTLVLKGLREATGAGSVSSARHVLSELLQETESRLEKNNSLRKPSTR
jgi:hypothetical protein